MRMHFGITFPAPVAALGLALLLSPAATPDVWDKTTHVRFGEPVEFPGGVVVPSGGYVLKLAGSLSNRHIVQVFNSEQDHIYATVLAIPTQRSEPAEKTIITFYETPRGDPAFIHKWFYPGDTIGQEFPYRKDRTRNLAREVAWSGPTPSASRESAAPAEAAPVEVASPERAATPEAEQQPAPEAAPTPESSPAPTPEAQTEPTPAPGTASTSEPSKAAETRPAEEARLPDTASFTPELALAGALLMLTALAMTIARRVGLGKGAGRPRGW